MKISAKGRYGLAAMMYIAQCWPAGNPVTIISIAERLGISKIYLEQVFSLLKRAGLVNSVKGAQGGYQISAPPDQITVYAVLSAIELALIEKTENAVAEKAPVIDGVLHAMVFEEIDRAVKAALENITLAALVGEAEKHQIDDALMYFI